MLTLKGEWKWGICQGDNNPTGESKHTTQVKSRIFNERRECSRIRKLTKAGPQKDAYRFSKSGVIHHPQTLIKLKYFKKIT